MFTWMMDVTILNAYTLIKTTRPSAVEGLSTREFKRRIADILTSNEKQNKRRREVEAKKRATETLEEVVGMDTSLHMLTPNSTEDSSGKLVCHLCCLRNSKKEGSIRVHTVQGRLSR
ncbi:hypothetical protein F441_07844 [Phytophthora nicotianae CJ01A1]|nr:hypothetical protein F441_07844 [Phytophthora nicotianae CJ01A1]